MYKIDAHNATTDDVYMSNMGVKTEMDVELYLLSATTLSAEERAEARGRLESEGLVKITTDSKFEPDTKLDITIEKS